MWRQFPVSLFGPLAVGIPAACIYDTIGDPGHAEGECVREE
jgi:hypothetical protein